MHSTASLLRLGTDFLAHIITGTLLGYLIDSVWDTAPLWMIVFILLGFVAACRTLWRGVSATRSPKVLIKDE